MGVGVGLRGGAGAGIGIGFEGEAGRGEVGGEGTTQSCLDGHQSSMRSNAENPSPSEQHSVHWHQSNRQQDLPVCALSLRTCLQVRFEVLSAGKTLLTPQPRLRTGFFSTLTAAFCPNPNALLEACTSAGGLHFFKCRGGERGGPPSAAYTNSHE